MIKRKRPCLNELIEKQNNFITPTKESVKEELMKLQDAINIFSKMLDDENAKPFSNKYTKILENSPYCETLEHALLALTYDKVKNLINDNKNCFKNKYEVDITNYSITIYVENNGVYLNAIVLDILNRLPKLTTYTYDKELIISDKENIESSLIDLGNEKTQLELNLSDEKDKLDKMLSESYNLVPSISTIKYDILGEPVETIISPVENQQNIINKLVKDLSKNDNLINDTLDRRNKIITLLNSLENIDFTDFEVLTSILERTLGIRTTKSCYVPSKRYEEDIIGYNEYNIGASGYTLKYIKKEFKPRKGAY